MNQPSEQAIKAACAEAGVSFGEYKYDLTNGWTSEALTILLALARRIEAIGGPVARLVKHASLRERDLQFNPLTDEDKASGWTETLLYALPVVDHLPTSNPVVDHETGNMSDKERAEIRTLRAKLAEAEKDRARIVAWLRAFDAPDDFYSTMFADAIEASEYCN